MLSIRFPNTKALIFGQILVCVLLCAVGASSQQPRKAGAGIAWRVKGSWQIQGKDHPLRTGDPVNPAALLQPDATASDHSVIILLPDGQRFLYECFTVADCARGFRVPALIHPPDTFAVSMLARIGAVLSSKPDAAPSARADHAPQTARQQGLAVLGPDNRVTVTGLLTALPSGRYTFDLRPLDHAYPPQFHLVLQKTKPSIEFALPGPGLYDITISDALNTPRVDIFLAAIRPAQMSHFQSFHRAEHLMTEWNDSYAGWPIDDFLRAYLEALTQDAKSYPHS